jgi:UPF0755 protein
LIPYDRIFALRSARRALQETIALVRILTQSLKIMTIALLAVFAVSGAVWFFDYWQDRVSPQDVGYPVVIQIEEEDDTGSVADKLSEAELINLGFYFETRMRFSDVQLQPGVYTLRRGMSVPEIIDVITIESVATGDEIEVSGGDAEVIEVTLIEGQRAEQFAEAIEEAGYENGAEVFMSALDNPSVRARWEFLDDVPADASLEGFLFPDTYTFTTDYTGEDMVNAMLLNFDAKVTEQTRSAWREQGLTVYEAVIIASIVEREAAVTEERPVIAAVYLNRVAEGMLLNADPTIQYAVGTSGEWWPVLTTSDLNMDSPYNSYMYEGLPPGPIANPGVASLQAVGQPADVEYLYFFAKQDGSGEHVFATTYQEHQQNVCEIDPVACEGASSPAPGNIDMAGAGHRWPDSA